MSDRLSDLAFGAGWALVCRLPERVARGLFAAIADLIWLRRGPSVRRYEANLRPVVDPGTDDAAVRALSRAGLRSYLRYWCEAFRLPATDAETLVARIVIIGEENLRTAIAERRGVVCALPHMANWDHAGAWLVATGERFTTVAERLRPASLYDRFVAYRERLGMEVLAATDPDVFTTLSSRLREGRVVALVADRDLSARGVEVALGRGRTRMPVGPAALAIRTGAALLPTTLWYDSEQLHVRFHPRVDRPADLHGRSAIAAMTQEVADVFGAAIAAHPQDWHMLQPFWLADLETGGQRA
jgi:KDO2-lipid IV(A) lauroyltransferase